MNKELFSAMEIDALGEMMNISLGSSATAVSNMLDHRVDITTPKVSAISVSEFVLGELDPAIGVEIKYVEGLEGSNIMLLRRNDVKIIVDILMGMETPDEEFELNELTISAVCEVMNQMMGASATALSDFLGFPVNISTPESFELHNLDEFKANHFPQGASEVVVVRFSLKIEDALESEFMNVMSIELAKEILRGLGLGDEDEEEEPAPAAPAPAPEPSGGGDRKLTQEEIEAMMSGAAAPAPEPSGGGDRKLTQEEIEAMMSGASAPAPTPQAPPQTPPQMPQMPPQMPPQMMPGMDGTQMPQMPPYMMYPPQMPGADGQYPYMGFPPMFYPPYPYPPQQPAAEASKPDPKLINTQPMPMNQMSAADQLGKEQAENLDLIMEVPLQVTVEIGRTRRKVHDILEFAKGSLVVLDKLAGDQVDLFVNGKCIARGDVVVVDDNFGVRITEIVSKSGILDDDKKSK